jgi:hypothetical protein
MDRGEKRNTKRRSHTLGYETYSTGGTNNASYLVDIAAVEWGTVIRVANPIPITPDTWQIPHIPAAVRHSFTCFTS